jgi:alkylation response protein AidB-like acyl-CoA dehydrogenase
MIGPAVGAARGALDAWSGWIARKTEMLMGRPVSAQDKASVQATLARSAAAIDAAELLMHRIAATADSGAPIDPGTIARSHRDYAVAAEYVTDAVERVLRASGARGLAEDSPIQGPWRDVHAATSHAALAFDSNVTVYARHVFGESAVDPKAEEGTR